MDRKSDVYIFRPETVSFLYSLLSTICLTISIVCTHIDYKTLVYYTSCHGNGRVEHGFMLYLIAGQGVLNIFYWHRPMRSKSRYTNCPTNYSNDDSNDLNHNLGKRIHPFFTRSNNRSYPFDKKSENIVINSRVQHSSVYLTNKGSDKENNYNDISDNELFEDEGIWGDKKKKPVNENSSRGGLKLKIIGKNPSNNQNHSKADDECFDEEIPKFEMNFPAGRNKVPLEFMGLDWNTMWQTTIFGIFFLSLHASLLGWRIFSSLQPYAATISTCFISETIASKFGNVNSGSPISEFVFIECFLAIGSIGLVVRKFRDPFLLSNNFCLFDRRYRLKGANVIYFLQALLQIFILLYAAVNVFRCWFVGYGTPLNIITALLLSFVSLWLFSTLSHVLQTDLHARKRSPTLDYHWLWMIIATSIIWACSILFYLSVYGMEWDNYFIPHLSTWIFLACITYFKFDDIFKPNEKGTINS